MLLVSGCRSERHTNITDWLDADIKTPPPGIFQFLHASTVVRYRGHEVMSTDAVYYLDFNQTVALRDDPGHRVIMVRYDGTQTDLACPNGASLAPERFPGIDCWAGYTTDDFRFIRYAASGQALEDRGAPAAAKECGRVRIGYMGYDQRGVPVVGYECMAEGRRMCRASTVEDVPQALAEREATTKDVDCAFLIKSEGFRGLSDVRRWSLVGD